jgi:hypothetical protein
MRLKLVILGVGAMLAWMGFEEFKLGRVASSEPQLITVAELESHGPGDNAHVELADFLLSEQAFVYESREGSSTWTKIWIPALPLGGEHHQQLLLLVDNQGMFTTDDLPLPKSIGVIVKSSKIKNEKQLETLAAADTLTGLIVNEIDSLGSEERRLLAQSYPGIDLGNVYILEHGRKPAGAGKIFGFMGSGALLVLIGLGSFFVGGRE